jgi:hypothetical protein
MIFLAVFQIRRKVLSVARRNANTNRKTKTMTTANATKKLTKAGFTVSETRPGYYHAAKPTTPSVIEYFRNGRSDQVVCINVRHVADKHDSQSDYCAGTFADSITQAIRLAV